MLRRAAAKLRQEADTRDQMQASLNIPSNADFWVDTSRDRIVADFLARFNDGPPDPNLDVNEGDCQCLNCEFAWNLARRILGESS